MKLLNLSQLWFQRIKKLKGGSVHEIVEINDEYLDEILQNKNL